MPSYDFLAECICTYIVILSLKRPIGCIVVMSMFVLSKWQRVVLSTRWHASVRTLFYCYLTFLDHRTNISRKVCAPRRISASGAPNKFQNCHLDKTNMDKTSQRPWGVINCKYPGYFKPTDFIATTYQKFKSIIYCTFDSCYKNIPNFVSSDWLPVVLDARKIAIAPWKLTKYKNGYREPLIGPGVVVWWKDPRLQKSHATVPLKGQDIFLFSKSVISWALPL